MSGEYPTAKFQSLCLSKLWEAAAGRVDYHLSDPSSCSYNTEPAAKWRALPATTQRSYIVVGVKRVEKQPARNAPVKPLNAVEAYMRLLDAMYELLWVTPNPEGSLPRKSSKRTLPSVSGGTPSCSKLRRAVGAIEVGATATILPLSAAWNSLSRDNRTSHLPLYSVRSCVFRSRRQPASPLAQFITVSLGEEDAEESAAGHCDKVAVFGEDLSAAVSSKF
ncbi:hypothetical protein BC835DRAFT_516144 [Cytidiella melzeri]|nr:hypothetical protein BC835DRAFT_516144 [Cytidiella melzeri]